MDIDILLQKMEINKPCNICKKYNNSLYKNICSNCIYCK